MMPEMSGYDVCRAIRRTDPLTPVMMLTAKGEEVDKVVGLELGADDYVVKPFGTGELTGPGARGAAPARTPGRAGPTIAPTSADRVRGRRDRPPHPQGAARDAASSR